MGPDLQPPGGPESYEWSTYAWVIWISTVGGIVAFIRKLLRRRQREINLMELVGQSATSAFAGVLAFWICKWLEQKDIVPPALTPAIVGIAGHMGSRAINLFEGWLIRKFPKIDD